MALLAKLPPQRNARRRRRLRSLAFVPTMMTLGNLVCGFAAVHFAMRAMYEFGSETTGADATIPPSIFERLLPSFLIVGAGMVILGMVFDLLDGLTARVTRSTTNFGGQLDSLADVVTFGVAPAALMIAQLTQELQSQGIVPSPISAHFVGRATWVCAALYVAFAAVRLARFNVEHAKADFDHRTFRGMPSPGAACVVVALILFRSEIEVQLGPAAGTAVVYCMPFVALSLAFLMVSRIPYRRFHRAYLLGKKPFSQVVILILLVAVAWSFKALALLLFVLWYAISGPVFYATRRLRSPQKPEPNADEPETSRKQA